MYLHTSWHVYTCIRTCIYHGIRSSTSIYAFLCVHISYIVTHTYLNTYVHTYAHTYHQYTHIYAYIHMHRYTHVCMYQVLLTRTCTNLRIQSACAIRICRCCKNSCAIMCSSRHSPCVCAHAQVCCRAVLLNTVIHRKDGTVGMHVPHTCMIPGKENLSSQSCDAFFFKSTMVQK